MLYPTHVKLKNRQLEGEAANVEGGKLKANVKGKRQTQTLNVKDKSVFSVLDKAALSVLAQLRHVLVRTALIGPDRLSGLLAFDVCNL